ncbi:response regulator [Methylobacterium nodulans]|uniref:Response regulator receiver protein n=1 Tax=Methylobacterium nodulans (strain LMG 21967 / CNCM I-2342 / ORS 2060) TaxID=460265 RepID=B8I9R3_METNO|nr:response regulator [Methylobacterium nodulans]ACL55316.1 response regulator receiver protein [Methylobacterium nodulans ORS 2060]
MLTGRRILIVEDEMLIALELSDVVADAQGCPIGPVRSNREALVLLDREPVDVAILDLNLADGEATPTAERLIGSGIPVLVCTGGVLPRAMRLMWPDLPVHRKPVSADRLIRTLEALCGAPQAAGDAHA